MSKQVLKEHLEEVPRTIAKSRTLDSAKSRLSRPRHEGEVFMSQLLVNDSRLRLQHCYQALKSIRYMDAELDKSMQYLTRQKEV